MSWVALGVGVLGAGATAYSASQTGDVPAPVPTDPGKDLLKYLKGLNKGLPQLASMESEYRPIFGDLNIADQKQFLNALLGMGTTAQAGAAGQLQAARQTEYANALTNTPDVLQILGGLNPVGARQVQQAGTLADQAYARSQGPLSFQENRSAQQFAREAGAARGRVNDTSTSAMEILGREDMLAKRRSEAAMLGDRASTLSQQFVSPAMQILMGAPASVALGADYLGSSGSAIGRNQPQFINPDAGINIGQQNAANMASWQMANANANNAQAATMGSIGSSLLGLAGTIYENRAR